MNNIRTTLEYINSLMKIIPIISVGIGALTVAAYCLKIEFYPVGLSISDTIFLIFIMLGFFITLIFGTAAGCLSTLFILPTLAKIKIRFMGASPEHPFGEDNHYENTDRTTFVISAFFFIILILIVLGIILNQQDFDEKSSNIRLILGFVGGGLFLGFGLKIFPKMADGSIAPLRKSKGNIIMICAAFVIPMILGSPGKIIQFPFSYFGISDRNATVNIDAESWTKIKHAAQLSKIEPDACLNGKDLVILKNSEILWSKIGDRALLRVFGKDEHHNTAFIEVEIPSKKIFPIKVGNTQIECTS
ncbi:MULTISPECIES: hypothetical protein [unclassified Thalassospira]|uniref:hypothetical protein n=1 Tax=unclassified Thalassospira TaxID=2648997 RepID=UPI0025EE9773|nr:MULTISPECIES: hypothetical protein [unclassified Thalassospira]|tara:strand:+ start:17053 stop:17961 length:909 start_codon:yes stop_codon:yes gene_type:complete